MVLSLHSERLGQLPKVPQTEWPELEFEPRFACLQSPSEAHFALLTCCCWLMSRSAVLVFSVFPPSPQRAFLADTQQISWQPDSLPQPQGSSGVLVNKTHTKTPSEITVQLGNWGSHCVRVWAGLSGGAGLAVPMLMPTPEAPVSGCVSTAADCSPPRQTPTWEVNQALFTCDVSHYSVSPERGSGVG